MQQYLAESPVGKFPKGAIITQADFTPERLEQLTVKGVLSPWSGGLAIPVDPTDLESWKRHAEALRSENKALRTATPDAKVLAAKMDLEKEVAGLKAQLAQASNQLAQLTLGTVTKSQFDTVKDKLTHLEHLHKTTVEALNALKKK